MLVFSVQYPGCGNENPVRVLGVHHNAADVLGIFQPQVLPAFSSVDGAVNAIAEKGARGKFAVGLSGPDIQDIRIGGRQGNVADRKRAFIFKYRFPGNAAIGGFEHAAHRSAGVDDIGVSRMKGYVGDPAAYVERPGYFPGFIAPVHNRRFGQPGLPDGIAVGLIVDVIVRVGALVEEPVGGGWFCGFQLWFPRRQSEVGHK